METTSDLSGIDAAGSLKRIEHIKAGVIDFTAGSLGKKWGTKKNNFSWQIDKTQISFDKTQNADKKRDIFRQTAKIPFRQLNKAPNVVHGRKKAPDIH